MPIGLKSSHRFAIISEHKGLEIHTYPDMIAVAEAAIFLARAEFDGATNKYVTWLEGLPNQILIEQGLKKKIPSKELPKAYIAKKEKDSGN